MCFVYHSGVCFWLEGSPRSKNLAGFAKKSGEVFFFFKAEVALKAKYECHTRKV